MHLYISGILYLCNFFLLVHLNSALIGCFAYLFLRFLIFTTMILPNLIVNPSKEFGIMIHFTLFDPLMA